MVMFSSSAAFYLIILWFRHLILSVPTLCYYFSQNTALHIAAINGHASVVNLLLSDSKAEVTRNNTNDNILDAAVKEKRSDVVMTIAGNDRWNACCQSDIFKMISWPIFKSAQSV